MVYFRGKIERSLVKGSAILLVTFGIYNILNFAYHFFMARNLSVEDYGVLATLFSIIYILGVFSESIQTIITKYISLESNEGKVKNVLIKSLKKATTFTVIGFVIFVLISIPLSKLWQIDYSLLALTGAIVFSAFLTPVMRGAMQSKKMFYSLGGNMMIEAGVKLLLAMIFTAYGLAVFGGIIAIIIGMAAALVCSFLPLKRFFYTREGKANVDGIWNYGRPVFVVMFVVVLFYSLDVIIAKAVFSAEVAGTYAIGSVLAKILFIGTSPISKAMFPISAENARAVNSRRIFWNSFGILAAIIFVFLVIFYFLKDLLVFYFAGREIGASADILIYLSVAIALVAITNLVLLYKLSVGKASGYLYLFLFVVIEGALLIIYSQNLFNFSIALIVSSAAFLIGSIILMNK